MEAYDSLETKPKRQEKVKTAKLSPFLIMTGKKGWRRHPEILFCKFCFASEVVMMMMMMMIEDNVQNCQVAFSERSLRNGRREEEEEDEDDGGHV